MDLPFHTVERECKVLYHRLQLVHCPELRGNFKYALTHTRPDGAENTWLFVRFQRSHWIYNKLKADIKTGAWL